MEPQQVWRVYLPEWLTAYTTGARGSAGESEAHSFFRVMYQGKIRQDEFRVEPVSEESPDQWEYRLALKLPNRRGEFRDRVDADRLAAELGPAAVVVARFSPEEKQLLSYGTRLLHDGH